MQCSIFHLKIVEQQHKNAGKLQFDCMYVVFFLVIYGLAWLPALKNKIISRIYLLTLLGNWKTNCSELRGKRSDKLWNQKDSDKKSWRVFVSFAKKQKKNNFLFRTWKINNYAIVSLFASKGCCFLHVEMRNFLSTFFLSFEMSLRFYEFTGNFNLLSSKLNIHLLIYRWFHSFKNSSDIISLLLFRLRKLQDVPTFFFHFFISFLVNWSFTFDYSPIIIVIFLLASIIRTNQGKIFTWKNHKNTRKMKIFTFLYLKIKDFQS